MATNSSALPSGSAASAEAFDQVLAQVQAGAAVAPGGLLGLAAQPLRAAHARADHAGEVARAQRLDQDLVGAGGDGVEALRVVEFAAADQHDRQGRELGLVVQHLGEFEAARVGQVEIDQRDVGAELGGGGDRGLGVEGEARGHALFHQPAPALRGMLAVGVGQQHAEGRGLVAAEQFLDARDDAVAVQRRREEGRGAGAHGQQPMGQVATIGEHDQRGTQRRARRRLAERVVEARQRAQPQGVEHQRGRARLAQPLGQAFGVGEVLDQEAALGQRVGQSRDGGVAEVEHADRVARFGRPRRRGRQRDDRGALDLQWRGRILGQAGGRAQGVGEHVEAHDLAAVGNQRAVGEGRQVGGEVGGSFGQHAATLLHQQVEHVGQGARTLHVPGRHQRQPCALEPTQHLAGRARSRAAGQLAARYGSAHRCSWSVPRRPQTGRQRDCVIPAARGTCACSHSRPWAGFGGDWRGAPRPGVPAAGRGCRRRRGPARGRYCEGAALRANFGPLRE